MPSEKLPFCGGVVKWERAAGSARHRCLNKERTVDEPKPPVPFTQQLLEQASLYREQARDLRAQNTLADPPPNLEAERLDALATELTTQAITSDAANESARMKAILNLDVAIRDPAPSDHQRRSRRRTAGVSRQCHQ
jgi:hypothetical protein